SNMTSASNQVGMCNDEGEYRLAKNVVCLKIYAEKSSKKAIEPWPHLIAASDIHYQHSF
ncbi:11952_t:CDS:1, partial [Dentiscutata heterogama]